MRPTARPLSRSTWRSSSCAVGHVGCWRPAQRGRCRATKGHSKHAQRALYDALVASYGPWADKSGFEVIAPDRSLLGPLNPLLFSPAIGAAQIDVFNADKATTSLPPRVHEVVILTVGAAWDSDYELYAHSATGRLAGLPTTS